MEKSQNWAAVRWLHAATGRLILYQLLAGQASARNRSWD